jgi:AAA domain-containing protein/carboxypeptidase family protein
MSTLLQQKEADASYAVSFYTVGGTLRSDSPTYIVRAADRELYNNLTRGHFCYALGQRQIGKSSLMVQTAARLRMEGVAVAVLDLTAIGFNISAEQWYEGLLARIGEQLHLEDELEDYWLDHSRLSPLQRWMAALQRVVLRSCKDRVVIFIDEVDAVLSLPFSSDEFFAGIRELYNRRTDEPELARLTFCLLGVATPSDLVRDIRITPFNIGKRIDLTDFTEEEAAQLSRGLTPDAESARALVRRVIYWTGGHPYLTQLLCSALSEQPSPKGPADVDRVCKRQFLSSRTREQNDNLQFVSKRILDSDVDPAGLLDLYAIVHRRNGVENRKYSVRSLWRSFTRVRIDETSKPVTVLWLSGIIRIADGFIYVRNRIYYLVFDERWVRESMPDAELRRQHKAYRKGLLSAAIVAALVILLILALAIYGLVERNRAAKALREAEYQRQAVEDQRNEVARQIQLTEEAQRLVGYRDWQEDLLIWELIRLDTNPATFEAYLETNPPLEYGAIARKKIETLRHSSAAEISGVIRGQVYDVATNQPIMGATITAKNQERSSERKMFSNEHGEFMVPLLSPGLYTITIEGPGYKTTSLQNFPVSAERINRIPSRVGLRKM